MFWSTLRLFGTYDRDAMWYMASFFTVCFFIPLYFIYPFKQFSWFGLNPDEYPTWFGADHNIHQNLYDGL